MFKLQRKKEKMLKILGLCLDTQCTDLHRKTFLKTHTEAFQLSTKWFSHHTTLEESVGGMLTLHTIPLYPLHTVCLCGISVETEHRRALFHSSSIKLGVVDLLQACDVTGG